MHRLVLSSAARIDLATIFDHSAETFGVKARSRYEALVEVALGELRADPTCVGSVPRPELGPAIRAYHLRNCRTRGKAIGAPVKRPRHLVIYKLEDTHVLVVRVLHDAMELTRHLPPSDLGEPRV